MHSALASTPEFQAIASANTGYCVGFTVPVQGVDWISSAALRDSLDSLSHLGGRSVFALFDGRIGDRWDEAISSLQAVLGRRDLRLIPCFNAIPAQPDRSNPLIQFLHQSDLPLAIYGFGANANEVAMILDLDPDYVLFDASVVRGIAEDARRRVVMANLISVVRTLGSEVITTSVDRAEDFRICRDLNCHLVQGMVVHAPTSAGYGIPDRFDHLAKLAENAPSHTRSADQRWITQQVEALPPISVDTPIKEFFDRMARNESGAAVPLVDRDQHPLGLLLEKTFKRLAYSAYGRDLLVNRGWNKSLRDFVTRCPIADAGTPLDQILAIYSAAGNASDGIIITVDGAYAGVLSAPSIIRAIHERTLARAQDGNPLTRLPGNSMIDEYVSESLASNDETTLVYLDFDNFKPFNDTYGFRQGDRAILLFADILRGAERLEGWFIGHIGGDDFVIGIRNRDPSDAAMAVASVIAKFASDALSFYDADTRLRGVMTGQDRDGNMRDFPLLTASAVIVNLPSSKKPWTPDELSAVFAEHKKKAKASGSHVVVAEMPLSREPVQVS